MHDLLGLNEGHVPSFVKRYANFAADAKKAFAQYVSEVADSTFPSPRR
jgi:3-methyl-2-oxobutanoate hydroxymethyltransferase